MMYKTIVFFNIALLLLACGESSFEVDDKNYEPKIVVEGYLYPGKPVRGIKITRNIPLSTTIRRDEIILRDANVKISNVEKNQSFSLTFDAQSTSFGYAGADLQIENGKSYRLDVSATVQGMSLTTSSVTRTPAAGLAIEKALCTDSIRYFLHGDQGELVYPVISFQRSEGCDFYAFSITAVDTSKQNFIYPPRNPFIQDGVTEEDIRENIYDLILSNDEVFDTPLTAGVTNREFGWFHFLFFGRYRIIIYAGDKNMAEYYFSYDSVYEMDGNLHEPVFNFTGDGLGVFGSANTDTVYLTITP
jgi:hypothetical protein